MEEHMWHLRPELEYSHCIDSWNIRAGPDANTSVVGVLKAGECFQVLQENGPWLRVELSGLQGWCYRFYGESDALVPLSQPFILGNAEASFGTSPTVQRQKSRKECVDKLILELTEGRRAASEAEKKAHESDELVRATSALQRTMGKLELLGVGNDQVLSVEGCDKTELQQLADLTIELKGELIRSQSYKHAQFANPKADSCWLSTFFQSLWHSRVFHSLFNDLVRPLPKSLGGPVTKALCDTWELYQQAADNGTPVAIQPLVNAWGSGYGDCADAFARLQSEPLLEPLTDQMAMVPVPFNGSSLCPDDMWELVLAMNASTKLVIALDLMLPAMTSASILALTLGLLPRQKKNHTTEGVVLPEIKQDLGTGHKLVAMICFMEMFSHYVVFCRRQSDPNSWLFFNDMPGLSKGTPSEHYSWASVAHECARLELRPKVLLYENPIAAKNAVSEASPTMRAALQAAAKARVDASQSYLVRGAAGVVIVLVLALVVQQVIEILALLSHSK